AFLRPNYHELVVESLPVETQIESMFERSCIEDTNDLPNGSIAQIRWIKPIEKRRADQRYAHAILSMNDRVTANKLILNQVIVGGKVLRVRKNKPDPRRCAKCNVFGHIAEQCKAEHDSCARCTGRHRMSICIATSDQMQCANCKVKGHGAASCECPFFLCKLKDKAQWEPERGYELFVTPDPETW
ncbi:hypothetical protein EV359DRAFT_27982, partial [Lentinula novae-zelandiae]